MAEISSLQWAGAFGVMGVMTWVALDAFTAWWPWNLIDPARPQRRIIGSVIILALGLTTYPVYKHLLFFVWAGIRHITGLDIPDYVD